MRIDRLIAIIIVVAVTIFLYQSSKYVIDESEQVVIIQFGEVTKAQTEPGTYYKIPIIQQTHYYKKKIHTAEDPIEYNFTGIHQTQVKEEVGLTFAHCLRAFLSIPGYAVPLNRSSSKCPNGPAVNSLQSDRQP